MAAKRRSGGPSAKTSSRVAQNSGGEFRGRGVVQTALIRGNNFAVKAVQYVVIDGLAIFEGDIVLGTPRKWNGRPSSCALKMASGVAVGVVHDRRAVPMAQLPGSVHDRSGAAQSGPRHRGDRALGSEYRVPVPGANHRNGLHHVQAGQRLFVAGRQAWRPAVRQSRAWM